MKQILRLGCFLFLAICISATAAHASDEGDLREKLYEYFMSQLATNNVGRSSHRIVQLEKEALGQNFLKTYKKSRRPIALAGCIDWSIPPPRLMSVSATFGASIMTVKYGAMRGCRKAKARRSLNCTCQIVDVNFENRLEFPAEFVRKFGNDSTAALQFLDDPNIIEYKVSRRGSFVLLVGGITPRSRHGDPSRCSKNRGSRIFG